MKVIRYFIDLVPHYLIDGKSYTEKEFQAIRDRMEGRRDRRYGIYDEWFRKNRTDGGKAYDQGCKDVENEQYVAKVVMTIHV